MFLAIAVIASILVSAVQIFALENNQSVKHSVSTVLKNGVLTTVFSIAVWKYIFMHDHFLITDGYGTTDFILFFLLAAVTAILVTVSQRHWKKYISSSTSTNTKGFLRKIVGSVLAFLGLLCLFLSIWGKSEFGDLAVDQLLINYFSPTKGTSTVDVMKAFEGPLFLSILLVTVWSVLIFTDLGALFRKNHVSQTKKPSFWLRNWSFILSLVIFAGGLSYGVAEFHLLGIAKAYLTKSSIIDDHYVDPRDASLQFPEKKRNLIHIYLESMENSYMSKDLGGFMDVNMIPELTQLATEGYSFSHADDHFGGPQPAVGTTWSVASMVNMSTGLPMKTPTKRNAYGTPGNFLPGAYSLGEILAEQGYEQTLMFGADADFGGLTYYFQSHGDFKIMDYKYARDHGLIPKNYFVWWGYEDDKLFEYAKGEITRLSQTGKPFHFVMETADTHRPDGYLSPNAPTPYENQYANVVAYSSAEVYKFVRWIQSQPFYENTTIVITGDHLSMETNFFEFYKFTEDYQRSQYNVILNPVETVATRDKGVLFNRIYANFDMFPTILSSMGVSIEGHRLGIGTDLFSGEQTLFEQYGFEEANQELEKMSIFYNTHILNKAE